MPWTTTELLAGVKLRAMLPDTGGPFSDAEILTLGDNELSDRLLPLLRQAQGEFGVTYAPIAIVANQASYRVPPRAVGGVLRDIGIVDAAGNRGDVVQVSIEDYVANAMLWFGPSQLSFSMQGDLVVLSPTPTTSGYTLRLYYQRRCGKLVPVSECARIASVNTTTGAITCANVPTTWTTANTFDILQGQPGFDTLSMDLTASNVSTGPSGSVTVSAALLPSPLVAGDYVCLAGEAPMPQIPADLHSVLYQCVTTTILTMLGKQTVAQEERAREQVFANLRSIIQPRVQGEAKRIINRHGPLRGGYGRWW